MISEPVLQNGGHWQAAEHFFKQIGSDVTPLRSTIITSDLLKEIFTFLQNIQLYNSTHWKGKTNLSLVTKILIIILI